MRVLHIVGRLPVLLLPLGTALALSPTGSTFAVATTVGAGLIGLALAPSAAQLIADRTGSRNLLLGGAVVHVLLIVLLLSAAEHFEGQQLGASATLAYWTVVGFTFLAGLSAPAVAVFVRQPIGDSALFPEAQTGRRTHHARDDETALLVAVLVICLTGAVPGAGSALMTSAVLTAVALPVLALCLPASQSTEAARLRVPAPVPGAELAQSESLQWSPVGSQRVEFTGSSFSLRPLLSAAMPSMLSLGVLNGALWIVTLKAAWAVGVPALVGLPLACSSLAAILWLGHRSTSRFSEARRRRLSGTAIITVSVGIISATFLPSPWWALVLISLLAGVLGWWQSEALAQLFSQRFKPEGELSEATGSFLTVLGFSLLVGMVLGLTVSGVLADAVGRGWAAAMLLAGATAFTVFFRIQPR